MDQLCLRLLFVRKLVPCVEIAQNGKKLLVRSRKALLTI